MRKPKIEQVPIRHTEVTKEKIRKAAVENHAKMSEETKDKRVSGMMRTKRMLYGKAVFSLGGNKWKASWRTIGGKKAFFRSRWESNYACYLEVLKLGGKILEWEHEPETFWFEGIKRGVCSYLPDFRVTNLDGSTEYHEVKGWMDARSQTKIKRMAKYHPEVKLILVQAPWFKLMKKNSIPGWEF
jgi:hypothetical protein